MTSPTLEKQTGSVEIGPGGLIDEEVLLGYPTGRDIPVAPAILGKNARIRSGTVIYSSVKIGDDFESGHNVVIREENSIGDRVSIWNNAVVDYGCRIGDNVKIHCNGYISQYTVIEDDVFIAPGVITANDLHPVCTRCMKGPLIKKGVRIGVNATILPRLTIGEYSLIGAGSVVTEDVPSRSVVVGNPGRIVKNIDELECRTGKVERPYLRGRDVSSRDNP